MFAIELKNPQILKASFGFDVNDNHIKKEIPINMEKIKFITNSCECGFCIEEELFFECPGCLRDKIPYCQGGSEKLYWEYCNSCWYQLSQNLTTVVIKTRHYNGDKF